MPESKSPWPEGKRCAFMLCFDLDGSTIWYNKLRAIPGGMEFLKGPSVGQYGPNCGADRILRILEKYGLKCTFFVPGEVARRNPDVVRRITAAGHEIAHHGLYHEDSYGDTAEAQMKIIDECQKILQDVAGKTAAGFRCTGSLLPETQKILYGRPDTLYSMFNNGEEFPRFISTGGRETNVVHLPCRQIDDYIQLTYNFYPPIPTGLPRVAPYEDVLCNFIDEADATRRYGGAVATAFHPQVSGGPGASKILEKFIQYLLGCDDVWLAQCCEVAGWWREHGKEAR